MKALFLLILFVLSFIPALVPLHAADVTIVAATLVPGANAQVRQGVAGVAITAGQLVYIDTTTNTWKLTDANLSAAAADVDGIAGNTAGAGQALTVITADDDLTLGGTTAKGTIYIASATAGGIAPAADLVSGWYAIVVAVGKDTTKIRFRAEGLRNARPQ
jgi:hypothetical protein